MNKFTVPHCEWCYGNVYLAVLLIHLSCGFLKFLSVFVCWL
jgi:hypothetical protein